MKGKIISIAIIILMVLGSYSVVANEETIEEESYENIVNSVMKTSSDMSNRFALSVGVNSNLRFCDDDARALNRILEENGWLDENCWVHTDNSQDDADSHDVKKSTIVAKLEDIRDNYEDANSITFFSFSGHGGRSGDSSFICFKNGNLAASELHDILAGFEGKVVCVFDSCHAGGMIGPSSQISFDPDEYVSDFISTVAAGNDDVYLLMACRIDQTTVEDDDVVKYVQEMEGEYGDGAGIWSFFVWDALRGEAEQNNDGKITGGEVYNCAGPNTANYADDHNWDIDPQEWGDPSIPIIGGGDPTGAVEVTVNMKQINEIDEIEPWTYTEWYYTIKIFTEENVYIDTKYQPTDDDDNNWRFDHIHKFKTDENLVNIELRVMEDDFDPLDFIPFCKDDMADISSDVGPGEGDLDNLEWTQFEYYNGKFDNAIFNAVYDIAKNELASGSDSCESQVEGDKLVVETSGDMQPDGSTNKDTNDAYVKFKAWSDYEALDVEINADNQVVENAELPFSCTVTGGISPYEYLWDFGDGEYSTESEPKHKYKSNSVGDRLVELTVTDGGGVEATDTLNVNVRSNSPPDKNSLIIDGPSSGSTGSTYRYTFSANDPDKDYHDKLKYRINWGDGDITDWLGPYNPGYEYSTTHKWNENGRYPIKLEVKDCSDETVSETLTVTMPRDRSLLKTFLDNVLENFPLLHKILLPLFNF